MKNYGSIIYLKASQLEKFTNQDLVVLNCGYYCASNSPFSHNAYAAHALLLYVHKGNTTVTFNRQTYQLSAGSVFLFPPNTKPLIYYHGDFENERYYIFFNGTKIEQILSNLNISYGLYSVGHFDDFIRTTKNLIQDFKINQQSNMFYKSVLLVNLFAKIYETTNKKQFIPTQFKAILPAINHMHENFQQKMLSIIEYAKMCYMSKSSFERLFKMHKKVSPKKYFMSLKIENAKMQLQNSRKSINEIAYDLNFVDPLYFSRVFKEITGKSPSVFRKTFI